MLVRGEGEVQVPAHLHFGRLLLDGLRRARPEKICLHNYTTGKKLTYGEFAQYAVKLAAGLTQLGIGRGDTVAVGGEPSGTYLPTGLAVLLTGAAFTPIAPRCGRAVLIRNLTLTKPKYVICTRQFWKEYSDTMRSMDFIDTFICFEAVDDLESVETIVARQSHVDVETFEPPPVFGQTDVAVIIYSSGTTGLSKGVLLPHLHCIVQTNMFTQWCHDLQTCHQPLQNGFFDDPDHSSGYDIYMMCAFICLGQTAIYLEHVAFDSILEIVQDCQVNSLTTVSFVVHMMLKAEKEKLDLQSLRLMWTSGGMLTPQYAKLFRERYPNITLINAYGMSETGIIATHHQSGVANEGSSTKDSCVGRASPGMTIKVADVSSRATLGPNQRGEICVRSPGLMKGYLGATLSLDEQGFFPTGDLGYYDDQKLFYLTGRIKDVICYIGYKISPGDIEAVLQQHPAVQEAVVVGKPTEVEGEELPAAFVVLRPGAAAVEDELLQYVADQVTWNMQLRGGLRFVTELPRNARRKVLRRELREMLIKEES